MRPTLSQCCACSKPSPSSPMRSSTGTLTFSKAISHGRSSITSSCGRSSRTPGAFMSTMKAEMPPREPLERSVAAINWVKWASSATRDEALGAVDDVVVALAHRGRSHTAGVAARVRLGLGEAPVQFAADGRQQILRLLLFVEVIEDRTDARAEHVDAARRQRDGAAELGPDGDLGDQPHAEPAVFAAARRSRPDRAPWPWRGDARAPRA